MRTDPREACANEKERWGWAIVHDLVAHGLMAVTNYSALSLRFHDWTSHKAWPRVVPFNAEPVVMHGRYGAVMVQEQSPGFWKVQHPTVRHAIVTKAADAVDALTTAEAWFDTLAAEFGGEFDAPAAN